MKWNYNLYLLTSRLHVITIIGLHVVRKIRGDPDDELRKRTYPHPWNNLTEALLSKEIH